MNEPRFRSVLCLGILLAGFLATFKAAAGGSGLNTVVIVNQSSSNSCELGNYFCERRQVPPENVLRISWPGGNISWSSDDFQTNLLAPLQAMLASRQLTNQIDYVVLSMDIPFQTLNGSVVNGTTSALFYGLKVDSGPEWKGITNSYAGSEAAFASARPASAPGYSFLTTMITADSLAQAKQLVEQGVTSDATFPSNPSILAKSSDPLRNARFHAFDNAIYNAGIRGNYSLQRTDSDSPWGQSGLLGYQTGLAGFGISPGTFVPGAIADSMTSFAGIIFGPNGQTTLLAFINAGAAGSYGTVTEPSADPQKFPDPQVYFYQARGFSLAECYYQSLEVPYQGLVVGEPLAAPFSAPAAGQWLGVSSNAVLTGTAPLAVRFSAQDRDRPLQQIDLFVDGKFLRALTNLPPRAGNVLNLTLNGSALNYTVPVNSTIASVASGLAALINAPANTNATRIAAFTFGDRIELRYFATNRPASPRNLRGPVNSAASNLPNAAAVSAGSSAGAAGSLTTFLKASRNTFLASPASGVKACNIFGTVQAGTWERITVTKVTGAVVNLSVTNQVIGANVSDLTGQFLNLINATPALQDLDGVVAEDFAGAWSGSAAFNVRARGQGSRNAATKISLAGSASLAFLPSTEMALLDNLSDLQPRNHLYVTAGATNLTVNFTLNTSALADGFHELTAVAYEGNHVRAQTRITLPVRVQNSTLSASLVLLDLPATAPVLGTYHLQVSASPTNISNITLFSTGGALGTSSNQASTTFTVNGATLGAGLHPFYAIVRTPTGLQYRTAIQSVRLHN